MPRGTSLSDVEKGKILAFREEGLTISEISRKVSRSRRVIQNFIKNPELYGKIKRKGRKRKLTVRDERTILRVASNSTLSCRKLATCSQTKVSKTTIWRTLERAPHIQRKKMKFVPRLLKRHIEARLQFAEQNMTTDWTAVIFSDEKKWNLDGPDGTHSYWRDLRKEPVCFSRRNFGGGSVMMWGAFSATGCLKIQFTSSKMNSRDYTEVLENSLVPFLMDHPEKEWIFQQDNAKIHTSNQTMDWFRSNSIQVMKWPACSPDLNPIENIWGILVKRVYAENRQYDSVKELRTKILSEWQKLDNDLLNSLIKSMKKRLFELIKAKGGQIDY